MKIIHAFRIWKSREDNESWLFIIAQPRHEERPKEQTRREWIEKLKMIGVT